MLTLQAQGATKEEAANALEHSRRAGGAQKVQPQSSETGMSEDEKAVAERMQEAGRTSDEAREMITALREFEEEGRIVVSSKKQRTLFDFTRKDESDFVKVKSTVFEELKDIDPNKLTPIQALSLLYKWKEENTEK